MRSETSSSGPKNPPWTRSSSPFHWSALPCCTLSGSELSVRRVKTAMAILSTLAVGPERVPAVLSRRATSSCVALALSRVVAQRSSARRDGDKVRETCIELVPRDEAFLRDIFQTSCGYLY